MNEILNETIRHYVDYTFEFTSWTIKENTPLSLVIQDKNGGVIKILNIFKDIIIYLENCDVPYCVLHEEIIDGNFIFYGGSAFDDSNVTKYENQL